MIPDYTKANFDFAALPSLLNARRTLNLSGVALGLIHLGPGQGYSFTHSHREQEEVYMVLEGSGQIVLDGKLESLVRGDFIRVSPHVRRALNAGDEGLIAICAGGIPCGYPKNENARYLIDDGIPYYDDLPPWAQDDPQAQERNRNLAQRMERSRIKKNSE